MGPTRTAAWPSRPTTRALGERSGGADLEWDASLRDLTDGLGVLFTRPEPKVTFGLMVRAILSDVPKKNSWGLAEHAGLATPGPFEYLLNGAKWDGCVAGCGSWLCP